MQYKIEIRPLATIEIIEAYDWYESQKEGLGPEFLHELNVFYDSLLRNPKRYSFYEGTVREGRLHRFPYVVVYEVFRRSNCCFQHIYDQSGFIKKKKRLIY